mgnify:CR=1 FL=1
MSTFAIDGLASGLDTTSIITQLMQLEQQPQARLQRQLSAQTSTINDYQSVSTRMQAVGTAATALTGDAAWSTRSVTVSGTTVAATAGPDAATGALDVNVTTLARAATWTTDAAYGLDNPVFTGFPIVVTKANGSPVSISPSSGTLRDVISAINGTVGTGVKAIAVKVGADQYRLQVLSTEAGTAAAPQSVTGLGVPLTAAAAVDAAYTINGIPAASGSNTISDAVTGVTLTLKATGSSTVTVAQDPGAIADKIQKLVDAMNAALTDIAAKTVKDTATPRGSLASDSSVRALTGALLQGISGAVGATSAATYGLQTSRTGQITFDKATFLAGYAADPLAARALVAPATGTGLAQRISAIVGGATGATGSITSAIEGRNSSKTDLQAQIDSWNIRLTTRKATLERQFASLEVALSKLQSQQSWLSGQLSSLNANNG